MTPTIPTLTSLIELWADRENPDADAVRRATEIARALNAEPASPTALRALAWRVLTEINRAAGWPDPETEPMPLCSSAAASVRHTNSLLIDSVLREVRAIDGPVLVTGALGASRSLFGSWDALPASGAVVVVPATAGSTAGDSFNPGSTFRVRGIRWARARNGMSDWLASWPTVNLRDRTVVVPSPAMLTACAASEPHRPEDLETLVFCAAAFQAAREVSWTAVEEVAAALGQSEAPTDMALHLHLDRWLGIEVTSSRKLSHSLKRLFVAPILRRHGTVESGELP